MAQIDTPNTVGGGVGTGGGGRETILDQGNNTPK